MDKELSIRQMALRLEHTMPHMRVTLFNTRELEMHVGPTRNQALGLQGGQVGLEKYALKRMVLGRFLDWAM